jgi:hypothetical protein
VYSVGIALCSGKVDKQPLRTYSYICRRQTVGCGDTPPSNLCLSLLRKIYSFAASTLRLTGDRRPTSFSVA